MYRNKTTVFMLALFALGIAPLTVQAAVFSDNFNSYTESTNFSNDAGNPWTHVGNYPTSAVATLRAIADESPFSAVSAGLAARYEDHNANNGSGWGFKVGFGEQDPTKPLVVEFDFKVITDDGIVPTLIMTSSTESNGNFLQLFAKNTEGNAFLGNRLNAGVTPLTNAPVALGAWYHVRVDIDPVDTSTDTYSVTLTPWDDGAGAPGTPVTIEDLPFRANLGNIGYLRFLNNGANDSDGAYVIDNVSVTVPEPATMALLAPLAIYGFGRLRNR
jgi:hypothetical protein